MPGNALAFVFENDNKQSISALIGAIEMDPRFDEVEICLIKPRLDLRQQIEALALCHNRVIVGFSFTTPKAAAVHSSVRQLRSCLQSRNLGNVTLVAGGPHPSGDWRQTLGMGFDIVVVGEGEISFTALLGHMS